MHFKVRLRAELHWVTKDAMGGETLSFAEPHLNLALPPLEATESLRVSHLHVWLKLSRCQPAICKQNSHLIKRDIINTQNSTSKIRIYGEFDTVSDNVHVPQLRYSQSESHIYRLRYVTLTNHCGVINAFSLHPSLTTTLNRLTHTYQIVELKWY